MHFPLFLIQFIRLMALVYKQEENRMLFPHRILGRRTSTRLCGGNDHLPRWRSNFNGEKHRQIIRGLVGVQLVGWRRLDLIILEDLDSKSFGLVERGDLLTNNQLTKSPEEPWLDDSTNAQCNLTLAQPCHLTERGCKMIPKRTNLSIRSRAPIPRLRRTTATSIWFFLLQSRRFFLSAHVLKLSFWLTALNFETYRPGPQHPVRARFLYALIMRRGSFKPRYRQN